MIDQGTAERQTHFEQFVSRIDECRVRIFAQTAEVERIADAAFGSNPTKTETDADIETPIPAGGINMVHNKIGQLAVAMEALEKQIARFQEL